MMLVEIGRILMWVWQDCVDFPDDLVEPSYGFVANGKWEAPLLLWIVLRKVWRYTLSSWSMEMDTQDTTSDRISVGATKGKVDKDISDKSIKPRLNDMQ